MQRPPSLKPGDTIGIAATARKVSPEEILPAITLFESWGLKVKLSRTLYSRQDQFAGTEEDRTSGFQDLLDDREVKAIICARGGYGTVKIIDKLDFMHFTTAPKWIIGYSDITVLHSHIHTQYAIQTLHGPMTLSLIPEKWDDESVLSLKNSLLTDDKIQWNLPGSPMDRKGLGKGQLVGGNLSVLYSLLGSASDLDTKGKILFLEDLDEYLYHIDRMMVNLKRNHKLDNLEGLIIGGMLEMKDNAIPFGKNAEEIILDAIKEYSFPVCFHFPAGHDKKNICLPFGANATLKVSGEGSTLEID